jgi:hypothetical protein
MVSTSDQHIDGLILSFARAQWQKVAMVISKVLLDYKHNTIDVNDHHIADRISALVAAGKLQSQGNLSRWRHSEVRLPGLTIATQT